MTDNGARTVLSTEQNDITKRLFDAVGRKETEFVQRLLRSNDRTAIDLNGRDNNGYTCLGIAATEGNVAMVKLLVEVRIFVIFQLTSEPHNSLSAFPVYFLSL